jgi:hypothetical protein
LGWLIGRYAQWIADLRRRVRQRLITQYVTRMIPYLAGQIALRLLALATLAALAALLINLLLEPVYVYPEYVPQVLVEPQSIAQTFWNLRAADSSAIALRTPQINRLLYFGRLCNLSVILTLAGGCLLFWKRSRVNGTKDTP